MLGSRGGLGAAASLSSDQSVRRLLRLGAPAPRHQPTCSVAEGPGLARPDKSFAHSRSASVRQTASRLPPSGMSNHKTTFGASCSQDALITNDDEHLTRPPGEV